MRATVRIVPQDEIARGTGEPPALKLPDRASLFADRAARLRMLAARAPDGGYLNLMGLLADAQQAALAAGGAPTWRSALDAIVKQLVPHLPEPSAALLHGLQGESDGHLENLAARVGEFDYPSVDARLIPFVGAALQVEWVHRAAALDPRMFGKPGTPSACLVCGSPPVASTLRIDIPVPGSRYLHCALCSTNWHMPRGQCTQCDTRGKLAYFHIEGGSEAIKAEACEECRTYLKVMNQEKDPLVDPVADDLATLALDVLMDESGYQRAAPNLFFVPGQT